MPAHVRRSCGTWRRALEEHPHTAPSAAIQNRSFRKELDETLQGRTAPCWSQEAPALPSAIDLAKDRALAADGFPIYEVRLGSNFEGDEPDRHGPTPLYHQSRSGEGGAADGFPVWEVPRFEGDDLIARAEILVIASADKDLLALVSDRVEVHSTRTGNRLGPDDVRAKLGVGPSLVVTTSRWSATLPTTSEARKASAPRRRLRF